MAYNDIKNYEFKKIIGEGNFAKVKLSIFKPTNEEYAIKIINKNKLKEKMKNTTFREIEIIQKLKHPNIINVFQVIEDEENYYLIMEICKKGELFDYIVDNQNLTEKESSMFFYQLINGVEYIHSQNFVHRDLKPENLLLTEDKIIKIVDFGLSHPFDGINLLKTKCGSPSYAAPEIIHGDEYDGFKTDIWCCGVILYAMLCGFLPFGGDNDTELFKSILECNPDMPDELSNDAKKLMKRIFVQNPNKRISIQEIKKSNFYLKGKKLFNIKYRNKIHDFPEDNNLHNSINLSEEEEDEDDNIIINKCNNKRNEDDIITIDEENNNNYEAITIASNDEDNDDIADGKKGNNINIFDINKMKKLKEAARQLRLNNINLNNKNKENIKEESENKKNRIYLHTFGCSEKSDLPKNRLHLNFNDNLKKNNYNNQIFNSFRKKLIKEDIKNQLKEKFENYQKIMKKEFNNDINKKKIEDKSINVINIMNKNTIVNTINNTIDNTINNLKNNSINNANKSNRPIITIPNIKDNIVNINNAETKQKLILKLTKPEIELKNSDNNKRKILLGKSPNIKSNYNPFNYLLTNNLEINDSQYSSFKRFINLGKISVKNLSSKRKIFNSNIRKKNNCLNTISKININNSSKNSKSKSIEIKNKNHIYHKININKNSIMAPWRMKSDKLGISNNSFKNNVFKNNIVDSTPKRTNLFYNNISININTINVNENRNHKLKLNNFSEKRYNKKRENNSNSSKKDYFYNKNKKIKINFSKIISKAKNKHNIYFSDKNNIFKTIGKSVEPYHNMKRKELFIKTENNQKNIKSNDLSKNKNIIKFYPRSEKRYKEKEIKAFH